MVSLALDYFLFFSVGKQYVDLLKNRVSTFKTFVSLRLIFMSLFLGDRHEIMWQNENEKIKYETKAIY